MIITVTQDNAPPAFSQVHDGLPVAQFSHLDRTALCRTVASRIAEPVEVAPRAEAARLRGEPPTPTSLAPVTCSTSPPMPPPSARSPPSGSGTDTVEESS